jgi:hypothetical protein
VCWFADGTTSSSAAFFYQQKKEEDNIVSIVSTVSMKGKTGGYG